MTELVEGPTLSDLIGRGSGLPTDEAIRIAKQIADALEAAHEQARGKAIDRRADIWAFGVVLFEILTGRRAFAHLRPRQPPPSPPATSVTGMNRRQP